MVKFEMSGGDEVVKALRLLGDKVMRAPSFRALEKAVEPTVAVARSLAPVDTGSLRASIGFRLKHYKKKKVTMAIIGPRRGNIWQTGADSVSGGREPANYAHLVEYGHAVVAKPTAGKTIRKKTAVAKSATTGRPFMRPAWDTTKAQVLANLGTNLGREVKAQAEKQSKRRKQK